MVLAQLGGSLGDQMLRQGVSLIQLWVHHSGVRLGRCHVDLINDPMTMAVTRMAGPAVEALIEARGFIPEAIQQLEERYEYAMHEHSAGEEIETDFVNAGPLAVECLPGLMDKLERLWPALEAIATALLEEGSMVSAGLDANILGGERVREVYESTV